MPEPGKDWGDYYSASQERGVNPFFAKLEPFLGPTGEALDLGCGLGQASLLLAERGWHVEALDPDPRALQDEAVLAHPRIACRREDARRAEYGRYDLILGMFSWFFMPVADFRELWPRLRRALAAGGIVAGQFLGARDDWAGPETAAFGREETLEFLAGLEILSFEEAERDGKTITGDPKHWHVFHAIARQPKASEPAIK